MPKFINSPVVFFNIGWMIHYGGRNASDPITGGHGHLKKSKWGAEAFNFASVNGVYYGYRPSASQKINITRLGAKRSDEKIAGVTVVWIAARPDTKDTVVVGWYRNATVWRGAQTFSNRAAKAARARRDYLEPEYMVTAKVADCHLLPEGVRHFHIKSSRRVSGGYGQSPTFYDEHDLYRSRVEKYILGIQRNVTLAKRNRRGGTPRNADPAKRKRVEETAVAHATNYFESAEGGGYDVDSVERQALGWDLHCTRKDGGELFVEVKGCSGSEILAELTPNEWSKMSDATLGAKYIVYVVTDCLKTSPAAAVFRHVAPEQWQTDDGRTLEIEVRPGARVSCRE